jgi:hypothetical protein
LVTYTVVPPEGGPITDGHRIVMPSDLSVARQQVGQHRLTLVTCHPPISGTHRLVVIARQTEPEVTTPPSAITALSARDVPNLGQLDFGSGQPPDWSEVLPPGVTALLIWATASRLSTNLDPRPRWRRLVRWIGLRAVGAAAAAVPLIVAFDRLARLWPTV